MIALTSKTHVDGVRAKQLVDFFLHCTDAEYQRWWPGTHLRFHTIERRAGVVGSRVFMDEWVGRRRVRMHGRVVELVAEKRIVWQLARIVRLPVYLSLELDDDARGVGVVHTIRAGLEGAGRILDPLFRLYFSGRFARAMDAHVHEELARLGLLLRADRAVADVSGEDVAPRTKPC